MKLKYGLLALACFAVMPATALAASEDECSIWLCLPGGFPDGCGAAKSAMLNRLKKLQPPLPDFGSCVIDGGSGSKMDFDYGGGAWLPERKVCVRESGGKNTQCVKYETLPAGYVKGQRCSRDRDGDVTPKGCRSQSYIEVYEDGKSIGDTYYW